MLHTEISLETLNTCDLVADFTLDYQVDYERVWSLYIGSSLSDLVETPT